MKHHAIGVILKKSNHLKVIRMFLLCVFFFLQAKLSVEGASMYNNPYIGFSPDGKAWTVYEELPNNSQEDPSQIWKPQGYSFSTNKQSQLRELEIGEHYYSYKRQGVVPIKGWRVAHYSGMCIHNNYSDYFHGVNYTMKKCLQKYYSGWFPICADCNQESSTFLIYMSEEAARSIFEIDFSLGYFYVCPAILPSGSRCNNLEMGKDEVYHICKEISFNQYRIKYLKNAGMVNGYMADSRHMYNDADRFEGNKITGDTSLYLNTYSRIGYIFSHWNTKPDGSGESFYDGQKVLNLSTENYENEESQKGIVKLYAIWKKAESTLELDFNGGVYENGEAKLTILGEYGSSYKIEDRKISLPPGYTISFDTQGGEQISPIETRKKLLEWQQSTPFHGALRDSEYRFIGQDKSVDILTALYDEATIELPIPTKNGFYFGGWYDSPDKKNFIGAGGDLYRPSSNIVLYASWVNLVLAAKENYTVYNGKGGIDLNWTQSDSEDKIYQIYQSFDGSHFYEIGEEVEVNLQNFLKKTFSYVGRMETMNILSSGFYSITALGAQGGNYNDLEGGLGGGVTGKVWLNKGDTLTIEVGGQNGYPNGGSGAYSNGGGMTKVTSLKKGVLLVAGGGGGSSPAGKGGQGGSQVSLVSASKGESGVAGGGGGYKGGTSGVYTTHIHNNECKHSHLGNANLGTGCYTIAQKCDSSNIRMDVAFHQKYTCYSYCTRLNSPTCGGHIDTFYNAVCNVCGKRYERLHAFQKPNYCDGIINYIAGCGRDEEYICGYLENQILWATPAHGGSNYISTESFVYYQLQRGIKSGNGEVQIEAVHINLVEEKEKKGVQAFDKASPMKIEKDSFLSESIGNNLLRIRWEVPKDQGTKYYHKVESYSKKTGGYLLTSNTTSNVVTSGIKGYYYTNNQEAAYTLTSLNAQNNSPYLEKFIEIELKNACNYFHIAPVDVAGNVGPTTTMELNAVTNQISWALATSKLQVDSIFDGVNYGNVYATNDKYYYVKGDGVSKFALRYKSYLLSKEAREDYQIDYQYLYIRSKEDAYQVFTTQAPYTSIGEKEVFISYKDFIKRVEGEQIFSDGLHTTLVRLDLGLRNDFSQAFTVDSKFHGMEFVVIPSVGATSKVEGIKKSQWEKDLENQITIHVDSQGPNIIGYENIIQDDFEEMERIPISLYAVDEDSGVKELGMRIFNKDNFLEKSYIGTDTLNLEISKEEASLLLRGDLNIVISARDNVGNETLISYDIDNFLLEAKLVKVRNENEVIFKRGEVANLNIFTKGYVDYIEICIPEELKKGNEEIQWNISYIHQREFSQESNIEFQIPLYDIDSNNFEIVVKAYKYNQFLGEKSVWLILGNETILDEVKVRIR